ncbi:MAG: ABC transporter substrate-binding protein [Desulfobacteraceae bacterium]|nr:MAG: ABC transporter substrate-binding protein [Desulfobacteraceae bacterium]
MKLTLSCACPPYDRVQPLISGEVVPEGIRLCFLRMPVEEIFWRQARHAEFDVSECSLSTYVMLRSRGDERFIAIPAFTSRFFRHSCVFVNTGKGIRVPQDLRGKTVGLPEYQITATVWLRGIFQDEYNVHPSEILWRSGGEEMPGRMEKVPIKLPPDIRLEPIPGEKTLSGMLEKGEIDALFTAREPSCFRRGSPHVARLFENSREVEEQYYRRTGIFPIMHTIVVKQEVYRKHPWIAVNLYKAFCDSKELALQKYRETAALSVSLPWLIPEMERTRKILGDDWWPYGLEKNRRTLDAFLRYHNEQGLSERPMKLDELFAVETLDEEFKI